MNSKKKEYEVKEYKGKIKGKDGKDKYQIIGYEEKKQLEVDENKTATINVKYKKITNGKTEDNEQKGQMIVKYKKGWFVDDAEITKLADDADIKEGTTVGLKGIGTFRWTFWGLIAAVVVLFGLLIWWWWASSRNEDKEEESL